MFDAQSLLGGLLKQATGSRNLGSKAALGMGAIGVAIAAFEHFTQENQSTAPSPTASPAPTAPPPPTTPPVPTISSTNKTASAPPPPPAPPPSNNKINDNDSLLLIDAMIAAASSDGHIDPDEESSILKQLYVLNSDQEGFDYVQKKMDKPPTLEQICTRVSNEETAKQVYMVSLLAITVDTKAEENYLSQLCNCLKLTPETVNVLHQQFLVSD